MGSEYRDAIYAGMTRERVEGTAMMGRGRERAHLNGNFNKNLWDL